VLSVARFFAVGFDATQISVAKLLACRCRYDIRQAALSRFPEDNTVSVA
jgi:hypothetical protein